MSSWAMFRLVARTPSAGLLRAQRQRPRMSALRSPDVLAAARGPTGRSRFSTTPSRAEGHDEETFEQFTARYEKEFDGVQDVFELQRNLNNSFAYDLVPSVSVCEAALRAARRVNDYPTAVRIFEGIKAKVENRGQYHEYLRELEPLRKELGVDLMEELFSDQKLTGWQARV